MQATPQAEWPERSHELAALLARSALGERRAFARLYQLSAGHLFAVVLRIQHDRAAAEEVMQEVFVTIWKNAGGFDAARAQPLTWLTHIARNRAIDSLRRAAAQPQTTPLDAEPDGDGDPHRPSPAETLASGEPGPLDLLDAACDKRQLEHCMGQLAPAQRQSVALAFFDGLSHSEVAEQLRQPLGTVKSWVRRALLTLKGCLEKAAERDARVLPGSRRVAGREG